MIEPTESESLQELDRFVDALLSIKEEIKAVIAGTADRNDNVLVRAPHTMEDVIDSDWQRSYSRESAVYPVSGLRANKFWPTVGRLDDAFGDRNVVCACPPMTDYAEP